MEKLLQGNKQHKAVITERAKISKWSPVSVSVYCLEESQIKAQGVGPQLFYPGLTGVSCAHAHPAKDVRGFILRAFVFTLYDTFLSRFLPPVTALNPSDTLSQ